MAYLKFACPQCGFEGTDEDFNMSLSDELFCPECDFYFHGMTGDDDEDCDE